MKVKELITNLEKLPQELPVLVSKDAEGNHFSFLHSADEEFVDDIESYDMAVLHPDDVVFEERDEVDHAVVLWP